MGLEAVNHAGIHESAAHGPMLELFDEILGHVETAQILQQTTNVAQRLFNAERTTIYRVAKETQELESSAVVGNVSRMIRVPIREDSLAGFCALTGRAFVVPDAYGDLSSIDPKLRFNRKWDEENRFLTRDVICAPAVFKDDVLGVVQIINKRGGEFSEDDLVPLKSVARFTAYALYNARIVEEVSTLKAVEKQKAEFMRILVHELKSPVAASKSLASALLFTHHDNPPLERALTRIERRMDDLLSMVQDILSLSKIKSGNPLGEITVCDLSDETRKVCDSYRDQAEASGLRLTVELPEAPISVRIDLRSFHLILSNLLSNAVKYTAADKASRPADGAETGDVRVRLKCASPWAVLSVTDSGMGIPEPDIPNLFDEFYRASNARKSGVPGTGVGLAGVKELVDRFGGQLSLESREQHGSTFTVELPVHRPDRICL